MKKFFIYLTGLVMCTTAYSQENTPGFSLSNLDRTVAPGNDFYRFACGGWMDANPLKPEYARFGTFDALRENSQNQVKSLIEEVSSRQNADGSVAQKIGDLYALAMDSVKLNKDGAAPLKKYLTKIQKMKNKTELSGLLATLFYDGVYPFCSAYVYSDPKNSSLNILQLYQGGFSMGDRDYYTDQDDRTQYIRSQYDNLIRTLFALAGYSPKEAQQAVDAILKIETRLAKASYSRVEMRDPEKNYHKISIAELQQSAPALNWKMIFAQLGLKEVQELNLGQPEPVVEVSNVIRDCSVAELRYYLMWNVINTASSFLSDDFRNASFEFYGKTLSGQQEQRPRWKRAVDVVNGTLGEAVGQIYVEKYFPPASKERMMKLVNNLQTALGERIQNLEWMSAPTKEKALEKLNTFYVKIGYPDKWRDYSQLTINKQQSYFENIIRSNNFDADYMFSKWNKPADRDEWLMTPQTVNAYYNPTTNEICFPAAILQPPFFNMDADDAINYGAIGVVIGHEMTHGFDDQGRQFDKNGNLADWWTEEDAVKFEERAQVLVDYFDNIVVLDTVHANGSLTLGENIADHGGLQVAWQAYQNSLNGSTPASIDGFTAAQRFFLGYATLWAGHIRDAEILRLTKIDPHSLGKWRVDGALPHIGAWYEAFGITDQDKMFLPKEKRASIW